VKIELSKQSAFGINGDDVIGADVYIINEEWDTDSLNIDPIWRDPLNLISMTQITTHEFSFNIEDSVFVMNLPIPLFNDWVENVDANYGLYFHPKTTVQNTFIELNSRSAALTQLYYFRHLEEKDSVLVDSFQVFTDGSVFNFDAGPVDPFQYNNDEIMISSGKINRALVKFDLTNVPDNVVMFSSNMILKIGRASCRERV